MLATALSRPCGLLCCGRPWTRWSASRGPLCSPWQRLLRCRSPRLASQCSFCSTGTRSRRFFAAAFAALGEIAPGLAFRSLLAPLRWRQLYSSSARLWQTDCDRLLWGTSTMFAFANMFHFLAHELPCLGGRRFAFAFVFTRPFCCFFFWHTNSFRPPRHIWTLRKCVGLRIYLITPRIEQLTTLTTYQLMETIIKATRHRGPGENRITHRHNSYN